MQKPLTGTHPRAESEDSAVRQEAVREDGWGKGAGPAAVVAREAQASRVCGI